MQLKFTKGQLVFFKEKMINTCLSESNWFHQKSDSNRDFLFMVKAKDGGVKPIALASDRPPETGSTTC